MWLMNMVLTGTVIANSKAAAPYWSTSNNVETVHLLSFNFDEKIEFEVKTMNLQSDSVQLHQMIDGYYKSDNVIY